MCVSKNARKFWKNRNSLPENSSLGNFQNMVMCMTGKMQKGAKGYFPSRLALYHILPTKSTINFTVYPFHSIVHAPRFTHTCTIGPVNPKSCARVCDGITFVFTLSDGFPVHCISSFQRNVKRVCFNTAIASFAVSSCIVLSPA